MMSKKIYPFEFPPDQHQDCQTLTELTIEHLPHDGSLGKSVRYQKNAYVWQPDDRQDEIFFLQDGEVTILLNDADGREIVLQKIDAGKPFGELCFCGKYEQRGSLARAVAASEAVAVTLTDFMDYMQANREVLAALLWTYCVRLADSQRRVEVLAKRGAEERLAHLLLHLATSQSRHYGEQAADLSVATLPFSHNELAQMAAMSRPHLTVTMNKFRRRGLIDYGRTRPLGVNVPKLKNYLTGE